MKLNFQVIMALVKRDLRMYFTNPTGYVFITLFILLSAGAAFWQERFFLNNLANLDQLNSWFPYLLLFFVPALTMGVWSTENKQGTDELLFTLPATDLEVVLGKYFATLGIYTAALILSVSHVFVLIFLGSPDLGLMFGNYFGYWLSGAALITVGMLASLLTPNITIAFILGALFCSFFVFIDTIGGVFGSGVRDFVAPLGIEGHFGDFARGVISFSGLLYFISLAGFMVYLNVLLVGRRHWPLEADGYRMWMHHLVRGVALVIVLISFNAILSRASLRVDVTAEQLHSLSSETENLLDELPDDRTVFIQAYLSKDVPQQFVQTRQNLIGFLKEIDATAGKKVEVAIYDTEPFSEEAREAREKFGITPIEAPDPGSARQSISQVFMGVAFTSGASEQVIPFFDRGLPTEYELTRSIRVVAGAERKKIGVVTTAAKVFGGFDFNSFNSAPEWQVVQELKKQYDVVQISAASPITEDVDGLMVPLPSSMPQEEMDNLRAYIETGVPTLIIDDPLPVVNISLAPVERSGSDRNPFMQNQGPPPKPKGDIQGFISELGFNWNIRQIVWDSYNPHPEIASVQPEIIFVGEGNENPGAFNQENVASAGLQELVLLFPGNVQKGIGSSLEYTPLLQSGATSGTVQYEQLVQRSFFGTQLVSRGIRRFPSGQEHTFAAQSKGTIAGADSTAMAKNINVVFISDLDFISEQFFEIRKRGLENLNFDNVTFFLNCMDMLVGDESFVELRKRRVRHRTLTTVESQIQKYIEKRAEDERSAESEAQLALTEAQNRLNQVVAEIQNRTDLDEQTKSIMARNRQEVENRKFEAQKARIEAEKEAQIAASKENMEAQIRNIQSGIKTFAVLLPPIPVFVIGVMIFVRRQRREREGEAAARRLRS